ncbi:MAG: hypothetical protein KAT27_05005, partial [Desulfobacterales bacterium]|nr:hypothetical protein [Desulfobacterales bacterium]
MPSGEKPGLGQGCGTCPRLPTPGLPGSYNVAHMATCPPLPRTVALNLPFVPGDGRRVAGRFGVV